MWYYVRSQSALFLLMLVMLLNYALFHSELGIIIPGSILFPLGIIRRSTTEESSGKYDQYNHTAVRIPSDK